MKHMIAMLIVFTILSTAVYADENVEKALNYLIGDWTGKFDDFEYYGKARIAKDEKSVMEKGVFLRMEGGWSFKGFVVYETGDKPDAMVIYVYNGNGAHFRTDAVVRPKGEFFEMTGKETGLYADGGRELADFSLKVINKDQYVIKFVNRTVNSEAASDQEFELIRRPQK